METLYLPVFGMSGWKRAIAAASRATAPLAGSGRPWLFRSTWGEADAAVILRALSGRTHQVHTGVAVVGPFGTASTVTTSSVTFRELTTAEISAYIATGDPLDKAGAYGIQGDAGRFVAEDGGRRSVLPRKCLYPR